MGLKLIKTFFWKWKRSILSSTYHDNTHWAKLTNCGKAGIWAVYADGHTVSIFWVLNCKYVNEYVDDGIVKIVFVHLEVVCWIPTWRASQPEIPGCQWYCPGYWLQLYKSFAYAKDPSKWLGLGYLNSPSLSLTIAPKESTHIKDPRWYRTFHFSSTLDSSLLSIETYSFKLTFWPSSKDLEILSLYQLQHLLFYLIMHWIAYCNDLLKGRCFFQQ